MHIRRNSALAVIVGALLMTAGPLHCVASAAPEGMPAVASAQKAAPAGIAVTPAALTLTIAKGAESGQASFLVTNSYASAIALHFSFAQRVKTPGAAASASTSLTITPADVVIAPGTSAKQVVTLTDSPNLAPGSQQIDLVMTQQALPGANVSVIPSIQLPLVAIKEDGAVTSFTAAPEGTPGFSLKLPSVVNVHVKNTGNMLVIPRGFASIVDPRGRTVGRGVLNTASLAIAPGGELHLRTPMVLIDHPWPPGPYRVEVSYSVGGGGAAAITALRLFYLPVWQMLLAALFVALLVCLRKIWVEWAALRSKNTTAIKPAPPAGDATL